MLVSKDSYMYEMIRTELTDILGDENVCTRDADKFGHSIDYYWIPEMWHDRGMETPKADFIVHPASAEEVSRVVKLANHYHLPVVPWGGGSGSQGGALPVYGGIIVDMKRMNKFLGIDKTALTVTCQTGMIARHLEWQCNKEGYSTMHLPASIACATIGGFLAHRGTGVLSTKYGKIEDMVMSLQVVTPTGEIIRTLPVPRHASGPDLTMLFLGSEGTLGIITEVTLKVHPQPVPEGHLLGKAGNGPGAFHVPGTALVVAFAAGHQFPELAAVRLGMPLHDGAEAGQHDGPAVEVGGGQRPGEPGDVEPPEGNAGERR